MPSNKSFRTKVVLAKAAKQNRSVLRSVPRESPSRSLADLAVTCTARSRSGSASRPTPRSSTTVRTLSCLDREQRRRCRPAPPPPLSVSDSPFSRPRPQPSAATGAARSSVFDRVVVLSSFSGFGAAVAPATSPRLQLFPPRERRATSKRDASWSLPPAFAVCPLTSVVTSAFALPLSGRRPVHTPRANQPISLSLPRSLSSLPPTRPPRDVAPSSSHDPGEPTKRSRSPSRPLRRSPLTTRPSPSPPRRAGSPRPALAHLAHD